MTSLLRTLRFVRWCLNIKFFHRVKLWADNLGKELQYIAESVTRRSKVIDSFKQTKIVFEKGNKIMDDIADQLRAMMADKERAVKKIVERAEYLSYYRKKPIFENSTFDYFNADNITNSTSDPEIEQQQYEDRLEQLQQFKCDEARNHQDEEVKPMHVPNQHLFFDKDDVRECQERPYIERKPGYYRHLPLVYHSNFNEEVNFNYSVMRIVTSVYDREDDMLNDIRWSKALDLVFQENFQDDPTLIWQYFAGRTGFLRHYPAIKWSDEQYERTYDFRTRAWYLEAISSPKDVIILLDMSGSMGKYKWFIAKFLVNNILDTLGDNDYVNIYLFNNEIKPLVDCFNFTLMQAHEENLRLLRESLNKHTPNATGNMKDAFTLAFATLQHFRKMKLNVRQVLTNTRFISIDYDYSPAELFETHNRTEFYTPVRVFTFLIGTSPSDEVEMVWIACANMGNIDSEIAEKVVKYLTVLSRPLNMNAVIKPDPIWTGTYADLADRRITNWLWQNMKEINKDKCLSTIPKTRIKNMDAFLIKPTCIFYKRQEYDIYLNKNVFNYMTTVSLPAYDFRPNATAVLGVAGVDIPIDYIKKLTMPHHIGVNGYAFILTNNGLLLLHPDHRKEFKNIIKPTFNRVDLTEAELVDDTNEPRDFNKSLLEMRDRIVRQLTGHDSFRVKIHLDNMRRVMLSRRHYFYTKIGPFSLVVALPDLYGFCKIKYDIKNSSEFIQNSKQLTGLRHTKHWKVHPEWLYCKNYGSRRLEFDTPEKELLYFLNELEQNGWKWYKYCTPSLVTLLVLDAKATEWFEEKNPNWVSAMAKHEIPVAFLATHSGLTRWRSIYDYEPEFVKTNNKAIDEVWYKRSVAYNYGNPRSFIYSVPLDLELDNETLVTASNAIFRESGLPVRKSPIAVVGFQMNHYLLESIFKKTTSECGDKTCQHTCDSDELSCFVLDNNAYVVVSDEGYTGKFFGKVRPDIMKHLVEKGLYRRTRFIDYQDICYLDPPSPKLQSPASKANLVQIVMFVVYNFLKIANWIISWLFYAVQGVFGAVVKDDPCKKAITSEYVKRAIHKTLPTPCDRQRWLYTLERDTYSGTNDNMFTTPNCLWPYIVHPIPGSNLVLLVINKPCAMDVHVDYAYPPDPVVLTYNLSMPCYIATKNNYTRRQYIKCINSHKRVILFPLLQQHNYRVLFAGKQLKLRSSLLRNYVELTVPTKTAATTTELRFYIKGRYKTLQNKLCISSDAAEAEQQVNNTHYNTIIEFLDNLLNAFVEKNDEYVKLLSMKASLFYEQSKILMLLENFEASKQYLRNALNLIQDFNSHPQIEFLHQRLMNHLAYLLSKDGDFEESRKLLESACNNSDCNQVLIYTTNELFENLDVDQTDAKSKMNKLVANNFQMLAWIYGKLGQSEVQAAKQHISLRKQLEVDDFDQYDWAYKCIRLAALYLASCNWSSACYHLVAAEVIIQRLEKDTDNQANVLRLWGDLSRAWTKYGLHLFVNSKLLFLDQQHPADDAPIEEKDQNQFFFGLEINTTDVPKKIVTNSEEARSLFLHTHNWLKRAKVYYNFRDYPIYYVNTVLDLSELLRFLAFYESDLDSQYNVQKRRADTLETLSTILREVRPQCYASVSVELLRELSEVQIEMMGINLRRLHLSGCNDIEVNDSIKKRISAITSIRMKLENVGEGTENLTEEHSASGIHSSVERVDVNSNKS
ncbi:hypothetical protein FQR65_LT09281 [Abscondita terminalis]|nr:hypothetical protein FQR65_LT09281 [Abscondita terminalis]